MSTRKSPREYTLEQLFGLFNDHGIDLSPGQKQRLTDIVDEAIDNVFEGTEEAMDHFASEQIDSAVDLEIDRQRFPC